MGETLNKFMEAGEALNWASQTATKGVAAAGTGGAAAIASWAGTGIEGFTEEQLASADEASSRALKDLGIDVPSIAPGGQTGAKVAGEVWAGGAAAFTEGIITAGSLPQAEDQSLAYMQYIIEHTLKCITNSMLTGPVSFAGMGFSVGSPMMHIVIIPFGDAQLNPLNIII